MWGGPVPLAYAAQGIVTLGIAAALVWLWRSQAAFALKAAALCIATLLATPYSLDYDMMLLAPAIAFLAVDGLERGFLALPEDRARRALARAAGRAQRRAGDAGPARRDRDAGHARCSFCDRARRGLGPVPNGQAAILGS